MLDYKLHNSTLTLREGIKELRDFEEITGDVALKMGEEMQTVLNAHDAVHVVFGCDTSIQDEALAHFVMIFGTDVRISDMRKVARNKDHRKIVSAQSKKEIFKVLLDAGSDLYRVLDLRRKMIHKWSWFGFDKHLDRPIVEIREQFGIYPISRTPANF